MSKFSYTVTIEYASSEVDRELAYRELAQALGPLLDTVPEVKGWYLDLPWDMHRRRLAYDQRCRRARKKAEQ